MKFGLNTIIQAYEKQGRAKCFCTQKYTKQIKKKKNLNY